MTGKVLIRSETSADVSAIAEVAVAAFKTLAISNHTEQFIIAALRAAQEAGTYTAATQHGLAILDREIELQAAVAAYNSVFLFLAVASLAALPLLLLVGRPTRTGKPASAEDAMLIAE